MKKITRTTKYINFIALLCRRIFSWNIMFCIIKLIHESKSRVEVWKLQELHAVTCGKLADNKTFDPDYNQVLTVKLVGGGRGAGWRQNQIQPTLNGLAISQTISTLKITQTVYPVNHISDAVPVFPIFLIN